MVGWFCLALAIACSPRHDAIDDVPISDDSGPVDTSTDDSTAPVIDADSDGFPAGEDCDDDDPAVNPDADEVCNGIDDDCDGDIDDDAVDALYVDLDGDGFGAAPTCDPTGVATAGDCDDADGTRHPGACEEPLDGVDDDCDGVGDLEVPVSYTITHMMTDPDEFQAAEPGPIALRVVNTDDGDSDVRYVHFDATKPTILVLSSKGAVKWIVDEAVPGTLQQILIDSKDEGSTVNDVGGVPTTLYVGDAWIVDQQDWDRSDTRQVEARLFDLTGLQVTSWIETRAFDEMTIEDGGAWPAAAYEYPSRACAADTSPFPEPDTSVLTEACGALLAKGVPVCLTTTADATFLFDADGNTCQVLATGLSSNRSYVTIGWSGAYLYGTEPGTDQVVRIHLGNGNVERTYAYSDGIADWDGWMFALDVYHPRLVPFTSWAELSSGVSALPLGFYTTGYTVATFQDIRWEARVAANFIEGDGLLPPYPWQPDIVLEGFADYIGGFDFTEDRLLVRTTLGSSDLYVFDHEGFSVGSFELPVETGGVACYSPDP